MDEFKDIVGRFGFSVATGPELEDDHHNFVALHIPPVHPARDPLDNFYLAVAGKSGEKVLMRSQTSTVQIRVMENQPPPWKHLKLIMEKMYRLRFWIPCVLVMILNQPWKLQPVKNL